MNAKLIRSAWVGWPGANWEKSGGRPYAIEAAWMRMSLRVWPGREEQKSTKRQRTRVSGRQGKARREHAPTHLVRPLTGFRTSQKVCLRTRNRSNQVTSRQVCQSLGPLTSLRGISSSAAASGIDGNRSEVRNCASGL